MVASHFVCRYLIIRPIDWSISYVFPIPNTARPVNNSPPLRVRVWPIQISPLYPLIHVARIRRHRFASLRCATGIVDYSRDATAGDARAVRPEMMIDLVRSPTRCRCSPSCHAPSKYLRSIVQNLTAKATQSLHQRYIMEPGKTFTSRKSFFCTFPTSFLGIF